MTKLVIYSPFTYIVVEEADCNADDENGPEDVETLQNHQQPVEKVVAKERFVDGHRVNPRTVNNAETEVMMIKEVVAQSKTTFRRMWR